MACKGSVGVEDKSVGVEDKSVGVEDKSVGVEDKSAGVEDKSLIPLFYSNPKHIVEGYILAPHVLERNYLFIDKDLHGMRLGHCCIASCRK